VLVVTTIKHVRQGAIFLLVVFVVGVQQVEVDAPDGELPDLGDHDTALNRNADLQPRAIVVTDGLHGQLGELLRWVFMDLISVDAQALIKVTVAVQEPHSEEIHVRVRCFLQVVAGQNTEATAVKLQADV